MKITPNQNFKHGSESYEAGKEYDVSDEDAEYFEVAGWVGEQPEVGSAHDLDVHSGVIGHSSTVN